MPQELHVLRCFSCKTFQVQIVKKVPKWQCKICNEKQSVLKVFARGSGKDCRKYVQDLNMQQGMLSEEGNNSKIVDKPSHGNEINAFQEAVPKSHIKPSKWSEFLEDKPSCLNTWSSSEERSTTDLSRSCYNISKFNSSYNSTHHRVNSQWEDPEDIVTNDQTSFSKNSGKICNFADQSCFNRSRKRKFSENETFNNIENYSNEELNLVAETDFGDKKREIIQSHCHHENYAFPSLDAPKKQFKSGHSKWSQYISSNEEETSSSNNRGNIANLQTQVKTMEKGNIDDSCVRPDGFSFGKDFVPSGELVTVNRNINEHVRKSNVKDMKLSTSKSPFCTLSDDDNLDSLLEF